MKNIDFKPYEPITESYEIRLDANESCFDLPKSLKNDIARVIKFVNFNRYPDALSKKILQKFAEYFKVSEENVIAGNGSDELISLIFQTFCNENDKVLLFSPDFSMYEIYCRLLNLQAVVLPKKEDLHIDFKAAKKILREQKISICIFSNPCNPTSLVEKRSLIKSILTFKDTIFVVDEAYMEFSNQSLHAELANAENLIILKTMSKAFGLASVRCGFAVSQRKLIDVLKATKSPYNVNSLTQIVTSVILDNARLIKTRANKIKKSTYLLKNDVKSIDNLYGEKFIVYDSATNFIFLKCASAKKVDAALKKNSIAVRQFDNFLRITCGTDSENERLILNLKKMERKIK